MKLSEFRIKLGAALKRAGAPEEMIDEVIDCDNEGGGVPEVVVLAWQEIDVMGVWGDPEMVLALVDVALLDVCSEYNNPMNYAPGHNGLDQVMGTLVLVQRTCNEWEKAT